MKYHLLTLMTAIIWSTTFVSTKFLLQAGMTPETIFVSRFVIAYILMVLISHKRLFANSLRDEMLLLAAGVTGGSLYFLTENTALEYTYATNVSILITVSPLLTYFVARLVLGTPFKRGMFAGSLLALLGVILVVFNGKVEIKAGPLGDLLTIAAALSWAVYSVLLKLVRTEGYNPMFVTRKVFFYGLLTMGLYMFARGIHYNVSLLQEPVVYGNLLFLGVVASFACFLIWNWTVEYIGPDKANNYVFLSPLGTMATAAIFLHEPVTWMAVVGALATIAGVVIVEKTTTTRVSSKVTSSNKYQ